MINQQLQHKKWEISWDFSPNVGDRLMNFDGLCGLLMIADDNSMIALW